jgi:hypothetical protein
MNSLLVDQCLFGRYDDIWLAVNELRWTAPGVLAALISLPSGRIGLLFKHQIIGRMTHDLHDL